MKETVRFMLDNAVGVDNAISTQKIVDHLRDEGCSVVSKEDWQINILGPLRRNGIFIGSKRAKGMFIIQNESDAIVVISQIKNRIQEETDRLKILQDMVLSVGWKID